MTAMVRGGKKCVIPDQVCHSGPDPESLCRRCGWIFLNCWVEFAEKKMRCSILKITGISLKKFASFIFLGTVFLLSGFGATKTWIGGTTGQWENNSNWDTGSYPKEQDDVIFNGDVTVNSSLPDGIKFKSITSTGNLTLKCDFILNSSASIHVAGDLVLGTSTNSMKIHSAPTGYTGVILTVAAKNVTVNGSFENDNKNSTFRVAETVELLVFNGNLGDTESGSKMNLESKAEKNIFSNSLMAGTSATISGDAFFTNGVDLKWKAFTCDGNLYVDIPEDQEFRINFTRYDDFIVNGSLVLTSGIFSVKKVNNITIGNDLVLLGKGSAGYYSEDDDESGIVGLFAYDNPNRGIANSVVIPTVRPDGTPMTVKPNYCGSMNVLRGSTNDSGLNGKLTVGKNFYNNGVNMVVASEYKWEFVVPKSTEFFAECYNAEICNSKMTEVSKTISASQSKNLGGNTLGDRGKAFGWDFTAPEIKTARTIYDDTIMLEFTEPVWNLNNQLINSLSALTFDNGSGSPKNFVKIYSDRNLTNELQDGEKISTIYVQTTEPNRWNTDATGTSSGYEESTDSGRLGESAKHRSVTVDLEIFKATDSMFKTFIDGAGNRIKHYKNTERFTATTDQCKPVLVAAYTGQEIHKNYDKSTGVQSQEPFDGHNFIELQYSEPVKIGNIPIESKESDFSDINNLQAQGTFLSSAYHGGKISKEENGLKIEGYGLIQNGKVNSYKLNYENGSVSAKEDQNVHSLYRRFSTDATVEPDIQKTRVRFGIAAFATTDTFNGNKMYAWNSYIVDSETPSGTFTPETNKFIQDAKGNQLDATGNSENGHSLAQIILNKNDVLCNATIDSDKTLYGKWDTVRPVFSMNFKTNMPWNEGSLRYNQSGEEFECIPASETSGSSYLDRLEFHFFDNAPVYSNTEEYKWVSENGWVSNSTGTVESGNYAGDISGGSRPKNKFGSNANATAGGVRRSSLKNVSSAFSYIAGDSGVEKSFSNRDAVQNVKSDYFVYDDSAKANSIDGNDSLYMGLFLNDEDKNISVNTVFKILVDENDCFITDLAGNLIQCPGSGELNTIDKIAPKFSLTLAAVGKNKLFVMFSKKLDVAKIQMKKIQDSFEFIKNSTNSRTETPVLSDLAIVDGSGKYILEDAKVTCIEFNLNRNVTLDDIKSTWIRVKKPSPILDPGTGLETYPTEIYDKSANYMQYFDCHALSDFAINSMEPTFAYTNVIEDETVDENSAANVIQSFAGNDFNSEKLFADRDITMQVKINDGTAENKSTDSAVLYFDSNVTGSRADRLNSLTGLNLKIWLPFSMASIVSNGNVPENPSGNFVDQVNDQNSSLHQLVILKTQFGWNKKDVVEFLGAICDSTGSVYELDNDGDITTEKIPLYALRLENEDDITSLAMWQFALTGISKQRGGVSIMKNVVNPELGDEVTIEVITGDGNLNVAVMTMDGNIIKYLEHGNVSAGTHYYKWNGKNKAGKSVARGIYFVRIFGQGIDETRKVMVVK